MQTVCVKAWSLEFGVWYLMSILPGIQSQVWYPIFSRVLKKVREKSRECHNHKPQPLPDPKRKRKPTNLNKHKPNKRTKSTKISSLFPKRGNRNTKRTEKHKNNMNTTNRLAEQTTKQQRVRLTPGPPP